LRVLIVTHYLGEAYPHGLERVVARLSTQLREAGEDVAVMTIWEAGPDAGMEIRARRSLFGVPVFSMSAAPIDAIGLPTGGSRTNRIVDRVLDHWQPDVVHMTLLHGLDPTVVEHIRRRGVPVVLDLHSYEVGCPRILLRKTTGQPCAGPDHGRECAATCFAELPDSLSGLKRRLALFAAAVAAADVVIACSPHVARWVCEICRVPEPRVVSPPVDPPEPELALRPRSFPRTRGYLSLAAIGGVDTAKGSHVAVSAVVHARPGPTQLAFLGPIHDRGLEAMIKRQAAEAEDFELVLAGAFSPSELSMLMSDVDVVLIPSQSPETYSLAAREAWSRGIPVFASRLGALADAVREGDNGFTFPHDDPQALGNLLRRVADEPDLLERLRRGADATPYVTPPEYATAFREVYREVAGEPDRIGEDSASEIQAVRPCCAVFQSPCVEDAHHADVFRAIDRDEWRPGGEYFSDPRSRQDYTPRLCGELPRVLSRLGVRRLVDVGCGGLDWMRDTELGIDRYVGVDVVFDVVLANRMRYGGPRRRFLLRDLTRDPLPGADLILCRDALIHLPDSDLITAMRAILNSTARWLLAGTFIDRTKNFPIQPGQWRPINLQLPPLSLPPPIEMLVDTPPDQGYADKRLALWDLAALRELLLEQLDRTRLSAR
jgi:glycosyltransferase involved in cell wall biosynthesis